jgi:hypothetical protein
MHIATGQEVEDRVREAIFVGWTRTFFSQFKCPNRNMEMFKIRPWISNSMAMTRISISVFT